MKNANFHSIKKNETIHSMKSNMMCAITALLEERGLKQADSAELLEVSQPRISNIKNGHGDKFSVDMLITMLGILGYKFSFDYAMELTDTKCSLNVEEE